MTEEQFNKLCELIEAMIDAKSADARNSIDGGLIEQILLLSIKDEAKALLVKETV